MRLLVFILLCLPAIASADQESDFLAARDAYRAGDTVRLEQMAGRLKKSPMEPYAAYYQLRMRLDSADPAAVKAFLARTDETPLVDRLRGEWLKQLGKKQQWEIFAAEYPRLLSGDTELSCYAVQARLRNNDPSALQAVRPLWLNGNGQPESCATVFEAALAAGAITPQDVWQRTRLALEAGNTSLAKQLAPRLPEDRGLESAALDAAASDPERYLQHAELNTEGQRLVALFALRRLSKQLPQLAYNQWDRLSSAFTLPERQYFFGWLAYEAARKLDPRAVEWFRQAGDAPLSEVQYPWRVRAALRVQNWREVLAAVNAMPPAMQREGAWRYWKARALKALGHHKEAEEIFAELGREYHFYGELAAEELGAPPAATVGTAAFQPAKGELEAIQAHPGIQRALILYRLDMRADAAREWSWAVRKFDDRQLLAAAELARRNEMYDRAIFAADKTVQQHDFNLRYLSPYREELQGHLREHGLEEAWVYGLMRQESRFVTQAKSNVGAAGLMQIMPATARWVARKLGMKNYRESLIHQLDTNLKLGTFYMKTVLSWFDNSPVLASAAYNAGPGRARVWRADKPLEGAIYAETIPFDETRDYVKKVMSNTVYYAKLFGQPPRTLKQRLGTIEGKTSANQQPIPDEK